MENKEKFYINGLIREEDINYAINEYSYIEDMLEKKKSDLMTRLEYYCLQEDGKLYFCFDEDADISKLKTSEQIGDIDVYDVADDIVENYINMNYIYSPLFTNLDFINRDILKEAEVGRASAYEILKYLHENSYGAAINNELLLNNADILNILDYPVYSSSICCKRRSIDQITKYRFNYLYFDVKENKNGDIDLLKEETERDGSVLILAEVSKLIKKDPDEFKELVCWFVDQIEEGKDINVQFTVSSKELEKEANTIIDECLNKNGIGIS